MNLHQTLHQTLHLQLVQLRGEARAWADGRPAPGFDPGVGICHNLNLSEAGRGALDYLLARWPAGTGDSAYVVRHPTDVPRQAYLFSSAYEKWHPVHEYARNRLALLDWLIEQTAPTTNN